MDNHIPTIETQTEKNLINRYFKRIHTLKPSDAFLLALTLLSSLVFLSALIISTSTSHTTEVAASGGTYTEGIIGTPRFVNPVLAVTRADKDLSTLIYDGLMRLGEDGTLIPSIAESVTVSEDGLTYNILLKQSVFFHDEVPLTARDVVFTFNRIQDPLLGSPLRGNFDGVTIEEVGEFELNFILPEAYAPFIENLSFGILPEHIWKDVNSDEFSFSKHNSTAVGAGPYKIEEIVHNTSGIPEKYILAAYEGYHNSAAKIRRIELSFFPSEERLREAFIKGTVQGVAGIDPIQVPVYTSKTDLHRLERIPLPRTFAVFLNQNKSAALRDSAAREALDTAIDREALIQEVLGGYANALTSPVPSGFGVEIEKEESTEVNRIDTARDILTEGGWKLNLETQMWEKEIDSNTTQLSFTISTVNNSAFEATAEFLRTTWEKLGVPVTIKQFEQTDLTQAIIRPRDYEALLFGTQLGRTLDYYSFWHSSQRNDPGLNIALYANITTDSILSEIRRSGDQNARRDAIVRFAEEIDKETPAFFLYAPELLYVLPTRIQNAQWKGVGEPQERFMNIHHWYIETESVWPFFTQEQN